MIDIAAQGIGQAVVADVDQNIQVISADRLFDNALGFPGTKAGDSCVNDIGILLIFQKGQTVFRGVFALLAPPGQSRVHLFT